MAYDANTRRRENAGRPCHRKPTMPRDALHGNTVPGGLKAWTGFALVSNLVRRVLWPSTIRQRLNVERLSCLDALRWLGAPPTSLSLMAFMVHPKRPHRVEPRVKKRRPKSVPLMSKPRQELRQP